MTTRTEHDYTCRIAWTGNRGDGTTSYRAYDRTWDITTPGKPVVHCSNDPLLGGDPERPLHLHRGALERVVELPKVLQKIERWLERERVLRLHRAACSSSRRFWLQASSECAGFAGRNEP